MANRNSRRPHRPNATGRSTKAQPFVMLSQAMVESAAYASLDLVARSLLWEMRSLFKGGNNGSLYLSVRDAAARLGLSDYHAVQRGFADLQDRGFLDLAKEAHFAVKSSEGSRARCWRLTWESWPECPVKSKRAPTNRWRDYQAPGGTKESRRADKRLRALADYRKGAVHGRFPVVESTTTEANMALEKELSVVKSTTRKNENGQKLPFVVVGDSPTYVDDTMGMGLSWWCSSREATIRGQILLLRMVGQNLPPLSLAA